MRWWNRSTMATLALAGLLSLVACGDDDGPTEPDLDLDEVVGLYEAVELRFDPQGSAPPANILAVLDSADVAPTLNIYRDGGFQLLYRDPVSGRVDPVNGDVEARGEGIELVFPSQSAANQFLFPRTLPLEFDAAAGTLEFTGSTAVSRARLQQLFPELYQNEQLFDPTPGTLTVRFRATDDVGLLQDL